MSSVTVPVANPPMSSSAFGASRTATVALGCRHGTLRSRQHISRYSSAAANPKTSAPYTTAEKSGASGLNVLGRQLRYQSATPTNATTRTFCASDSDAYLPEGNATALLELESSDTSIFLARGASPAPAGPCDAAPRLCGAPGGNCRSRSASNRT